MSALTLLQWVNDDLKFCEWNVRTDEAGGIFGIHSANRNSCGVDIQLVFVFSVACWYRQMCGLEVWMFLRSLSSSTTTCLITESSTSTGKCCSYLLCVEASFSAWSQSLTKALIVVFCVEFKQILWMLLFYCGKQKMLTFWIWNSLCSVFIGKRNQFLKVIKHPDASLTSDLPLQDWPIRTLRP